MRFYVKNRIKREVITNLYLASCSNKVIGVELRDETSCKAWGAEKKYQPLLFFTILSLIK